MSDLTYDLFLDKKEKAGEKKRLQKKGWVASVHRFFLEIGAIFQARWWLLLWGCFFFLGLLCMLYWAYTAIFFEPDLANLPRISSVEGPLRVRAPGMKGPPSLEVYKNFGDADGVHAEEVLKVSSEDEGGTVEGDIIHAPSHPKALDRALMPPKASRRASPGKKVVFRKNVAKNSAQKKALARNILRSKKLRLVQKKRDQKMIASVESLLDRLDKTV